MEQVTLKLENSWVKLLQIPRCKYDPKKKIGCIVLEIEQEHNKNYIPNYKGKPCNPLSKVNLDLKTNWQYIFSAICEIYTHCENIKNPKFPDAERFFNIWKIQNTSMSRVESFSLVLSVDNKEDSEAFITLSIIKEGRIPEKMDIRFTKRQTSLFIHNIIAICGKLDNFISYLPHETNKDKFLILKKDKKFETALLENIVNKESKKNNMSTSDLYMLTISAEHRLKYGIWLKFQGENVSIDKDGFLTTLYEEINLEATNKMCNGSFSAIALVSLKQIIEEQ